MIGKSAVLREGKAWELWQILLEAGLSHDMLRQHLARLELQDMIVNANGKCNSKQPSNTKKE